jgi:predicted NUDIX family NTP pyrophosphohydrolase
MMQSAGILLYKTVNNTLRILLAHPGGPFWAKKNAGAWTIPKGEIGEQEEKLEAARREFFEETGQNVSGRFIELSPLKQKGGKVIHAWALMHDLDETKVTSNTFEMEWPPRSGKMREFPEIDRVGWFTVEEAFEKILPGQKGFISELQELLK